jgi:hypothetical protein
VQRIGTTARLLLAGTLIVAVAACGSNGGSSKSGAAPQDGQEVARTAVPLLAPFGLRVQRSSVEQKAGPVGGSELSLYAQPTRTEANDVYAQRMMPLTAAVIPALFAKYRSLDWIDLCQEPAKSSGAWETVPVTRLEISRTGAERVDWKHADLAQLLAAQRARPLDVSINWQQGIGRTRAWRDATARSLLLTG